MSQVNTGSNNKTTTTVRDVASNTLAVSESQGAISALGNLNYSYVDADPEVLKKAWDSFLMIASGSTQANAKTVEDVLASNKSAVSAIQGTAQGAVDVLAKQLEEARSSGGEALLKSIALYGALAVGALSLVIFFTRK